jgi:hypothetical protein
MFTVIIVIIPAFTSEYVTTVFETFLQLLAMNHTQMRSVVKIHVPLVSSKLRCTLGLYCAASSVPCGRIITAADCYRTVNGLDRIDIVRVPLA